MWEFEDLLIRNVFREEFVICRLSLYFTYQESFEIVQDPTKSAKMSSFVKNFYITLKSGEFFSI